MRVIYRLAALAIIAILAGGGYVLYRLNLPYRGFSEPVFLEFPRGASTREMSVALERKGVVPSRWLFLAARVLRRGAKLQAGEYRFDKPASPLAVYGRISRGDIYFMELLVPEGFNLFEIA